MPQSGRLIALSELPFELPLYLPHFLFSLYLSFTPFSWQSSCFPSPMLPHVFSTYP